MTTRLSSPLARLLVSVAAAGALRELAHGLANTRGEGNLVARLAQSVQGLAQTTVEHLHTRFREVDESCPSDASGNIDHRRAALSRAESAALLGLAEPFTKDEVKRAHHEAMRRNHPDQGGNTYLAQLINDACDRLLSGGE